MKKGIIIALWVCGTAWPVYAQDVVSPSLSPVFQAGMVEVPVLVSPVAAGMAIQPENVTKAPFPAKQIFPGLVSNPTDLAGAQATRAIKAGEPMNKLHIRPMPAVMQNQMVQVTVHKPGIELTGSAKALQNGQVGEVIRVLNLGTKATLMGTVTGPGTVEIQ